MIHNVIAELKGRLIMKTQSKQPKKIIVYFDLLF